MTDVFLSFLLIKPNLNVNIIFRSEERTAMPSFLCDADDPSMPDYDPNLTVSNSSITSIAVTAALARSGVPCNSSLEMPPSLLCDEGEENHEDPTSLKSVLAALSQSQAGKGVKRARINEIDDTGSKRQCSDNATAGTFSSNSNGYSGNGYHNGYSSDASCPRAASSPIVSYGGEKRALDTSSSSSLDNSGHGSPCAKVPRTGTSGQLDCHCYEESEQVSNSQTAVNNGDASASCTTSTSVGASLNSVGLGGGDMSQEDEEYDSSEVTPPVKKKRCVNPWEASMSSSRNMLARAVSVGYMAKC